MLLLATSVYAQEGLLKLPPLPAADHYGDLLIDRVTRDNDIGPVYFSHWVHRAKHTCRVCHYELEFSMRVNDTPIVCDKGRMNGRYCAACHDGKTAFGPKDEEGENCRRCHDASPASQWKKFSELQGRLPKDKFGNEINWASALDKGLIQPAQSLSGGTKEIVNVNKTLTLKAEMAGISSAVFPHKTHEQWLDCSNCHPDLFNIKKKTTASLRMSNMIRGESCGLCHLRVAFPLDDCKRCHPTMKMYWGGGLR